MESVNLSKILKDVRVILDQNAEDHSVPVGEYTLELDEVITKGIVPAVQWAHMNAPVNKLKGKDMTDSTLIGNAFQLPSDFMRLVTIRAYSWKRGLFSYFTEEDPQVSQILSGYPGLMPTVNKPAMVFRQEDGANYLMLYPFDGEDESSDDDSTEGDYIVSARYIPFPKIDWSEDSSSSDDVTEYDLSTIDIEPSVYEAFLYYLAYLVKISYNEDSKFMEQAQALL